MAVTSQSLIDRLRRSPSDADWRRLHDLYQPLIHGWVARIPGIGSEADDLIQDVLVVVLRKVRDFERRREGSFRTWLRHITLNQVRDHWRRRARAPRVAADGAATNHFLDQLEDSASEVSVQWDAEHDRHVLEHLFRLVRPDFERVTWKAFQRFALDGVAAAIVAAELGTTENAVVLAKSRVLKRLRDEAGELLD